MRIYFPEANTYLVCVPKSFHEDSDDSDSTDDRVEWVLSCADDDHGMGHWVLEKLHDRADGFKLYWDTETDWGLVHPFADCRHPSLHIVNEMLCQYKIHDSLSSLARRTPVVQNSLVLTCYAYHGTNEKDLEWNHIKYMSVADKRKSRVVFLDDQLTYVLK